MKEYMNASLPPRKRAELLLGDPAEASMEAFASVDQQVSADYPPPASGAAICSWKDDPANRRSCIRRS